MISHLVLEREIMSLPEDKCLYFNSAKYSLYNIKMEFSITQKFKWFVCVCVHIVEG